MRKRTIYKAYILAAITIAGISSCRKIEQEDNRTKQTMAFMVITPEVGSIQPQTRSEISAENIQQITLFGKKDNGSVFGNAESITVSRPTGTIWKPAERYYWESTPHYLFHAYSHSAVSGNGSITVSNQGKAVEIVQPSATTTDPEGWKNTIDYLLSYSVDYAPSETHQVVPIVLEHALTKVSLYITQATSMLSTDVNLDYVKVRFDHIKNAASMICNKQKDLNKDYETTNEWSFRVKDTQASYTLELTDPDGTVVPDKIQAQRPTMSFIAIPSDRVGLADYLLSMEYKVTVTTDGVPTSTVYSREFELKDYTEEWTSGHNVIYTFHIDNGIHLTGSIKDWVQVDYIEGTVLPPILDDKPEEGGGKA